MEDGTRSTGTIAEPTGSAALSAENAVVPAKNAASSTENAAKATEKPDTITGKVTAQLMERNPHGHKGPKGKANEEKPTHQSTLGG